MGVLIGNDKRSVRSMRELPNDPRFLSDAIAGRRHHNGTVTRSDGDPRLRDLIWNGIDGSRTNITDAAKLAYPQADLTDKMLQQVRKAEALRTKLGRTRQSAMTRDTLLGGG